MVELQRCLCFWKKKTQLIARFVYTFISVCFIYLESYSFEINPRSFWELYNLSILSVHRIKDYIKSRLAIKHLRDPDGGIHLARKKAQLGEIEEAEPDVKTSFPTKAFSDSLNSILLITFKAVWTYMVACMKAKRQLSTAKPPVKGFNFFKSGHVLTVKSCTKPDTMRTYIKSQVLPSMKKTSAYSCCIILKKMGWCLDSIAIFFIAMCINHTFFTQNKKQYIIKL